MKYILSLDLGTHLGYCVSANNSYCVSANNKLLLHNHIKFKSPFSHDSYLAFYNTIFNLACSRPQKTNSVRPFEDWIVVVEKPNTFAPGYHAKRVLFGMLGIVQFCFKDEDTYMVSATTIKKHLTGSGGADKKSMIESANKLNILHPITDDNEADAVAISNWFWDKEARGIEGLIALPDNVAPFKKKGK